MATTSKFYEAHKFSSPNFQSKTMFAAFVPIMLFIIGGAFLMAANFIPLATCLDNGLALTPPMGWLAWERFTCEIDCDKDERNCIRAQLFKEQADKLIADGYHQVGYEYVNVDDCWSEKERDSVTKQLVPDKKRFNEGIDQLAKYVHDKGLKLGLYGDCGTKTCAGYPAQLKSESNLEDNYFNIDASSLAQWQVDSFKFDGCYIDPLRAESICPKFSAALNETNRQILLVCEWPFYMMYSHAEPNYELAAKSCNVWRYYDDIEDSWSSILNTIDYTVKQQSTIVKYHGPGHWFDPDQLVIGNFGLSDQQERAQMAIWCVWSAPLYMSNDLREIRSESAELLKNKNLIKVNQDLLGVFGLMVEQKVNSTSGSEVVIEHQAFVKPVLPIQQNGCPSFVVVYLNRKTLGNKAKVSFKLRDLLLGAPIRVAYRHQMNLIQRQQQQPNDMLQVNPSKCIELLSEGMTQKIDQTKQQEQEMEMEMDENDNIKYKDIEFEFTDLFGDLDSLGQVALNGELTLDVNPSGVRAVLLKEKIN